MELFLSALAKHRTIRLEKGTARLQFFLALGLHNKTEQPELFSCGMGEGIKTSCARLDLRHSFTPAVQKAEDEWQVLRLHLMA